MTLSNSVIGLNVVTWNIGVSKVRQGTGAIIRDRDMQHWHFLKLTCVTRTPRQGPQSAQSLSPLYTRPDLDRSHPAEYTFRAHSIGGISASTDLLTLPNVAEKR